jgi:NhaP-type Na+/H+ or K+/H+ antiporter
MPALTYLALVLGLGILAQWLAWRLKIPSILLLLVFGFGLSVTTGVRIDDYLAQDTLLAIVGIFVALILFEGGLTLKFAELKEAGNPVLRLCSIGVAVALVTIAACCRLIFGFDWQVTGLLGAILVVTGPTVISPLLRVVKPVRKIGAIVKWEGIVVDPIGAILAVLVFQVAIAGGLGAASGTVFLAIGKTLLVGIVLAVIVAKLIEFLLKHHLIPDFLESVFLVAVVAVAFAASNRFQQESGLLTVTVLGIALANQKSVSIRNILAFKEHLRILIISLLFILLSGRIDLASLQAALVPSLIFLAALVIICRPASIFLASLGSRNLDIRERLFLAALAPRGIVAAAITSIFAIELEHAATPHSDGTPAVLPPEIAEQAQQLVPIVFLVIIGTVLIYGVAAAPLARLLGLASANPTGVLFAGADSWIRLVAKALQDDGHSVLLLDTKYEKIAAARLEGLHAVRANILSEYAEEELELSDLGTLIAATPNDEVNSLATQEFGHVFSRAHVWQIAPQDKDSHHMKAVAAHRRGRICFLGGPTYGKLQALSRKDAVIKKTLITDVFTLEDFQATHGNSAIILFLDDEDRGLRPARHDLDKITPNTTVYALVLPESPKSKEHPRGS